MREAAILARDLSKQFKTGRQVVTAVDGLCLEVAPGETYGLIGPDGAGKSTTSRVILGLLTRTGGESRVLGYDSMRDAYQIHAQVGYIAQQFALPATLTVLENMQFFAGVQGVSREQQARRIPELLAFAGLAAFQGRPAGSLSGGMKKKLALACSLVHQPRVVVLDEPTLGVDPVSRREFWNLLGNLRIERGLTIFVCTPYMDEAERCTRIGLLYRGKLIAGGTPAEIKALVRGHVLELTPRVLEPARHLVGDLEGVLEVQTYGDRLHIFVDDVAARRPAIEAALDADGIRHDAGREIPVRMEEAYISLLRRQAGGPSGSR